MTEEFVGRNLRDARFRRVDLSGAVMRGVMVDGEWSFVETLRHLVMATYTWLRGAALRVELPYHPIGQPDEQYATDGHDPAVFSHASPTYAEVLEVRANRVALVRDFPADVTPDLLAEARLNPWAADYVETVPQCVHTILEEGSTTATPCATSRCWRGADLRRLPQRRVVHRLVGV